jgi:sterol desaturase/sphingolipid hydroxylase (fatty acid hydroxylase superfamily)
MLLLLKRTIQPILLITYMGFAISTYGRVPEIVILLSMILFNTLLLVGLESIIPFELNWSMTKKDFKESTIYFTLGVVSDSIGKVAAIIIASRFSLNLIDLPLYLSVPMAVIVIEFFGYWIHRYSHSGGFFWKIHSIHHTPEKINTWNNNKLHPINIFLLKFVRLGSLILFGFNAETIFLAGSFGLIQNYISHANIDIQGRWYSFIIGTPEMHRLHHSIRMSEAGNFSAVIPYWDMIFGSFVFGKKVKRIGVHNRRLYPDTIEKKLLFAFSNT